MAKTLDFNTLKRPSLTLVMQDERKTRISVTTPTTNLIEELQASLPELEPVLREGNKEGIAAIYDLAARLINCNRSFIKVTGEELRAKYGMELEDLLIFFNAYLDFITEIKNEKN